MLHAGNTIIPDLKLLYNFCRYSLNVVLTRARKCGFRTTLCFCIAYDTSGVRAKVIYHVKL